VVAWLLWSVACQFTVMDWPTSAVVGAVTEVAARSTASVAASSMSRPVELSDSVKNGLNPLKLVKLPVAEAKDSTPKVWLETGQGGFLLL